MKTMDDDQIYFLLTVWICHLEGWDDNLNFATVYLKINNDNTGNNPVQYMKGVGKNRKSDENWHFLDIQQVDQAWSQDYFSEGRLKKKYFAVMQYHFEDPWRGGGRNQNFRKSLGKFREISGNFSDISQKFPGKFPDTPGYG